MSVPFFQALTINPTMLLSPIYTLSPSMLLNMVKSGAARILHKENIINQMNYFPISDHDTGSNIASLMRFLLAESYSSSQLSGMLKQIADASLVGACGNSGMIFSAFFVGFASSESHDESFTTQGFTKCVELGVKQAYQSVQEPVEGTILTVMREWLNACKREMGTRDFLSFFEKSIQVAKDALKKTQYQLPVLKRSHVVDAGAYGFVEFLQGMYHFLANPTEALQESEVPQSHALTHHDHEERPDYRYCFESLLSGGNIDVDKIKALLKNLGNSLVVNQSFSFTKIHLHTNDVMQVTYLLQKQAHISHQKIDDMIHQWQITENRKYPIALVTDSNADVPSEFVEQNQIHILPIQIRLGDSMLLDRITVNLKTLFHKIHHENQPARTAPPSPDAVSRYLNFLTSHYESVIVITASSHLSSMHQIIANQAAKVSQSRITVIDSLKNAVAQGLLVMKAAELIEQGKSHAAIVEEIEGLRQKAQIYVAFDELKTIIKSGRAPRYLAFLNWLPIKPIICLNAAGKPRLASVAFGRKHVEEKIILFLKKFLAKYKKCRIGIVHSSTPEYAQAFSNRLTTALNIPVTFVQEASAAVGINVGQGCIGIGVISDEN